MIKIHIYTIIVLALPLIILLGFRLLFFKEKFSPKKHFGDFISLLYLGSLFLGIVYFCLHPDKMIYDASLAAMTFLSICLVFYFAPIYYFQRRMGLKLDIINRSFFKLFCVFMLIGGLFSIAKFAPLAMGVFSGEIDVFRIDLNTGKLDIGSKTWIDTLLVGFSTFFGIVQLLGLIVFCTKLFGKWSKFIGIMLLLSSISYILNAFAYAGRDGVVYWILSLFINMIFVRMVLGGLEIDRLIGFGILTLIVLSIPFFFITISRFHSNWVDSVFLYVSHQVTAFNDVYVLDPPAYYGDLNFREIKGMFVDKESLLSRDALFGYYLDQGVIPWKFKFFIGSFLADFGKLRTLILMALMALLIFFSLVKKGPFSTNNKIITIDTLLLLYLYCQIGFMGVFYFKHLSLNNYMLALVGLSFVLYFLRLFGLKSLVILK